MLEEAPLALRIIEPTFMNKIRIIAELIRHEELRDV